MTTFRLNNTISPAFRPVHHAIKAGKVNEIVLPGGRGSTKSSFLSIELILQLLKHPDCHAAVFRKVGNTLRTSVYAQVCWAITELGLYSKFRCTVSPMECTYKPTGQKILFFGLDDPGKVKSIKVPFGYIGIGWFEELDQFAGPEEIRNVEQSVFRGGSFSLSLKSFNPPPMARNWANRYVRESVPGRMVVHSTYLTVDPAWLGPRFLADAENLKITNPTAYRHEYLGEVVGNGTQVFENIQVRPLTTEELNRFERIYHGVDWGWYPDPWAYNGCRYDPAHKTLYIYDELTRRRTSNEDTAKLLIQRGVCQNPDFDEMLTADSAEPKSCSDYRSFGLPCREAVKGPSSVKESMKWLQSLNSIVIDQNVCPDTAQEFSEYEYETDPKTGDVLAGYPDINNHHIDAVRYALNRVWRRRGQ